MGPHLVDSVVVLTGIAPGSRLKANQQMRIPKAELSPRLQLLHQRGVAVQAIRAVTATASAATASGATSTPATPPPASESASMPEPTKAPVARRRRRTT